MPRIHFAHAGPEGGLKPLCNNGRYKESITVSKDRDEVTCTVCQRMMAASAPEPSSRDYMLRVRLTPSERLRKDRVLSKLGVDASQFLRDKLLEAEEGLGL